MLHTGPLSLRRPLPDDVVVGGDFLWTRYRRYPVFSAPWLAGRTVVPESTLTGPEMALQQMGKTPLGRYLFTSSELTRDFIEIGRDAGLWGRRSRLRLSGKPLMLTELFLPASPLY